MRKWACMKTSTNYSKTLDDILSDFSESTNPSEAQTVAKEKLLTEHHRQENKFNLIAKKYLLFGISTLFVLSHMLLAFSLAFIFVNETDLIKSELLDASDRSITSQVVMTLIGGSVTQTAVAFIVLVKYFFGRKKDEESNDPAQ